MEFYGFNLHIRGAIILTPFAIPLKIEHQQCTAASSQHEFTRMTDVQLLHMHWPSTVAQKNINRRVRLQCCVSEAYSQ